MKKQELIEKLKAAGTLSSSTFIPVSDVIKMVEDLETESSGLSDNIITSIAQEVAEQFDNKGKDVINDYDIDTDVSGNTIEVSLSHVSFDSYEIESIVEYAIEMYVTKKEEEENNQ